MGHVSATRAVDVIFDPRQATIGATTVDGADIRCVRTRVARRLDQPQPRPRQTDPRSGHVDSRRPRIDARGSGACEWRTADAFTVTGGATYAGGVAGRAVEPL